MKQIISTKNAPKAIGPYSQAVKADKFLFISGQLPLNPETMKIEGETAADQAGLVFQNMTAILTEAGLDFSHLVKTTVLLENMDDFAAVNEVYSRQFSSDFPARAAFQVAKLPLGAKVEIEAIAYTE